MTSKTLIDPQTFGELQANAGADFVVELVDTFATEAPTLVLTVWGAGYKFAAPYFDVMTPGDYDGDGKMDLAVFRRSSPRCVPR